MLAYVRQVVERAEELRRLGEPAAACQVLHALLVVLSAQPGRCQDVWGCTAARELLGETVTLLAIQLLQLGETQCTDGLLGLAGFRYRLAAAALQPPPAVRGPALPATTGHHLPPAAGSRARPPAPAPLVLDAALAPPLLASLRRGFAPAAAFWQEHGYWDSSAGFFSYVYPLAKAPEHPVEEAIAQLRKQLLEGGGAGGAGGAGGTAGTGGAGGAEDAAQAPAGGPCNGTAAGSQAAAAAEAAQRVAHALYAEWWVHTRDPGAPHQLHYDVDETRLRRGLGGYALRHPLLGSLLFLEASPAAHGATLVLDQVPGDEALAERGWLVRPAPGRSAVFRGDLLHGVMPGILEMAAGTSVPPRTTLMVAWWEFTPDQEEQLAQQAQQPPQAALAAGSTGNGAQSAGGVEPQPVAPGPMLLPPWRLPPRSAQPSWPAEFSCSGDEPPSSPTDAAACGSGAAAGASTRVEAVELLQPAWVRVGASAGAPQCSASAALGGEPEQGGSCGQGGQGPGTACQPGEEEHTVTERAQHSEDEPPAEGHALPLLFPPLRFFLFSASDINAAYCPGCAT